mgnify:FL=1
MEAGTLYVVATPIGNLADISERARETLALCDVVACEDTRVTGALLNRLGLKKEMFVNENSREKSAAPALLKMLSEGKNIALVSDAGTPCVSDPGFRIVRACRAAGVKVSPVPGPCAFISALCASGLPSDSFLFAGFLPPKASARRAYFEKYADFPHSLIFYESPYRIEKFAADALEIFGENRAACFAKEITKFYERFFVGKLGGVCGELKSASTKGEFTVIIAPRGFEL